MANWLKRPRAQSRNPATRRQAVSTDPLDALGQPLEWFAREDTDPGVRKAALRRAAELALVTERMQADTDPDVRAMATGLYRELLAGKLPQSPSIDARLQLLADIDDRGLLEHLACEGSEPGLREAALHKLNRPGLVLQRLLEDPDRDLRLRLLDSIDDPVLLERICQRARRRDRQLQRQAEARLTAIRIAAGDQDTINAEAERLCNELEHMPGGQVRLDAIDAIDRRWQALAAQVGPILTTRYNNARQQSLAAANAQTTSTKPESAPAAARNMPRMDEPEHPSGRVEPSPLEVQRLAAENRFLASLAATGAAPKAELETKVEAEATDKPPAKPARKKPALDLLPLLEALEVALEQGNLGDATGAARKIRPHQATLPHKLEGRWQRAQGRVAELQQWQSWSNRRQRRQLCVDARAMRNTDLHPEAIANRIHELRQSWKQLEALQPRSGSTRAADAALQRRFHALCRRALEPTRAWFEQRDALRAEHTQRIETLLQTDLPASNDWKGLAQRRRELAAARRELDQVEPRARKSLARRLTRTIERISAPLDEHYQSIRKARERLIEKAEALMQADPHERIGAAHDLQAEWKALEPGRRDLEHRQWRKFRTAMDAVFSERDRQRQEQTAEKQARLKDARQLLDQLQSDIRTSDDPQALQAALHEAQRTWRQIDVRDRALAERWDSLQQDIKQRIRGHAIATERQRYRDWMTAAVNGEAHPDLPSAMRKAIAEGTANSADPQATRGLLVAMEALAGIDSPAEDHARRMQVNLERLQASLGGGRREDLRSELETQLAHWLALGGHRTDDAHLQQRFTTALEGVLARLQ